MSKYNITEKHEKNAAYRSLVKAELVDELYEKIVTELFIKKKYRDPAYSAKILAQEIGTNTRYISAVVNLRFHQNYSCLINEYRIKEAMYMLVDKRYESYTMEEISKTVGFANRQSFYAAFYRLQGCSPRAYKMAHQLKKK
ncbi:MAG: AraC family transcriptional regulator [Bacteroidales bacterium]|nr:AraC family transcriptional regulator [Bacteroidales bacterium]